MLRLLCVFVFFIAAVSRRIVRDDFHGLFFSQGLMFPELVCCHDGSK